MDHDRLMKRTENPLESFMSKIHFEDNCWIWQSGKDKDGYGLFKVWGKTYRAHRWIYEQLVESIPTGLQIDHLCRIPPCVNLDHLEPVTCRVNLLRGNTFNSLNAQKTHCLRGHLLEGDYIPGEHRFCRICAGFSSRKYRTKIRVLGEMTD